MNSVSEVQQILMIALVVSAKLPILLTNRDSKDKQADACERFLKNKAVVWKVTEANSDLTCLPGEMEG